MFLTGRGGYDRDGEQFHAGKFLAVFTDPFCGKRRPELRAVVRYVYMSQLGNWMMGRLRLAGYSLTMSGTYGSDGLPCDLRRHVVTDPDNPTKRLIVDFTDEEKKALWEMMTPLPAELQTAFWEGGGHNCAGREGPTIQAWGKANLKALSKAPRPAK